jgi:hypothetical protein
VRWRALLCCLLLGGCTGTETGNPSLSGSLGYDAYTTRPSVVALLAAPDPGADVTVVDSAWLVLGDVGFVAQSDCSQPAEATAHAPGLGAGDHAATQAPATRFDAEVGRYCGVTLPLMAESTIPTGAPAALAGASILIDGQRPGAQRFRIVSTRQSELFLRSNASGFELTDESSGVLIGFDVASWLGTLDWGAAVANAKGVIEVDSAHNPELLAEFERRLGAGIALYVDRDRDGKLDSDTPTPIATAE